MGLHEPHQMHGVQAAGKPAISFVDVIADQLGAGDAFVANLDSTVVVLCIRHQIRRIARLSRHLLTRSGLQYVR